MPRLRHAVKSAESFKKQVLQIPQIERLTYIAHQSGFVLRVYYYAVPTDFLISYPPQLTTNTYLFYYDGGIPDLPTRSLKYFSNK